MIHDIKDINEEPEEEQADISQKHQKEVTTTRTLESIHY